MRNHRVRRRSPRREMATLRVDHPDIEEFGVAKREKGRLEKFNMYVLITRRLHGGCR